jgi:transcriptional regulator with XRE-family HTH domain
MVHAPMPQPSSAPIKVGAMLRETRRGQGMTMDRLADATGLTKGFISRVERDETSPSIATLVTICQVLSLPVGALFEEPDRRVVALESAPLINMGGTGATERLVTPRSEARIQMLRSTLAPGSTGGEELYTINCDAETMHVITGDVVVRFTSTRFELGAGDTITFSGRDPHSWDNPGDAPAEIIWTLVPAAWSGSR